MAAWADQFRATPAWARSGLAVILSAPLLACTFLPLPALIAAALSGFAMFVAGYSGVKGFGLKGEPKGPQLWLLWLPWLCDVALVAAIRVTPSWCHWFEANEWTCWIWFAPAAIQAIIGAELTARLNSREGMAILGAFGGALALAAAAPFICLMALGGT